jgi:hypothetical protein
MLILFIFASYIIFTYFENDLDYPRSLYLSFFIKFSFFKIYSFLN